MNSQTLETVAPFYAGWRELNERLVETIGALGDEELEWSPAPGMWPIWALVGHLAGGHVYWLCAVLKEPGADRTPFGDPSGEGWEDDLSRPHGAAELVDALRSTWDVVEGCLHRWTVDLLEDEFRRERNEAIQIHTRQSVIFRLITHDASHAGEISQTLGSHGRDGIDLWAHLSRVLPATEKRS